MSVLDIPRVYFRGEIAWDPVTTNNYAKTSGYPASYDEDSCNAIFERNEVKAQNVSSFRCAAVEEVVTAGNWNPHGTYRSPFFNARITGVKTGGELNETDDFVGAPVAFTGMLVDAEPYGAMSSQLFFDHMSFGIDGGCRIRGQRMQRMSDRYINFNANPGNPMIAGVASVLWQTCFDKGEGLVVDAFGSDVLERFAESLEHDDVRGVMVRFCTYRTVYYDDLSLSNRSAATQEAARSLRAKLDAGGWQPNPARSLLVGTIGLWREGEAATEPSDRALLTTGAQADAGGPTAICGTAFARVSADNIALDLSNCIPAFNRQADKCDLGNLTLVAADPSSADDPILVKEIPYSEYKRTAYEASSGIVDISISTELARRLSGMNLMLRAGTTQLLEEAPLRAIPDTPNLYVNQGEPAEASVRVYERGKQAGEGIKVTMSDANTSQFPAMTVTTDASGRASFPLNSSWPVVVGMVFDVDVEHIVPVDGNIDPQRQTYMYLRVLPLDEDLAKLAPTWQNVHDKVLANWEAMAPCMDNWLRLGDEAQVRAFGPIIKKLTDPENFESSRFMPVTRDMTKGQRTLLYRFLDGLNDPLGASRDGDERAQPDLATLSRAMRGGSAV